MTTPTKLPLTHACAHTHDQVDDKTSLGVPAIELGPIQLDVDCRTMNGPRGSIQLTPGYYAVLERLMRRPGVLVSQTDLISVVYPDADAEPDNAYWQVRLIITRLRAALALLGGQSVNISNDPTIGYRIQKRGR